MRGSMDRRSLTLAGASLLGLLTVAGQAQAQNAPTPLHQPRGKAVDVSNTEILAAVAKATATSQPFSNQTLRMVNVNGEYNLGVSVLYRAKADAATLEAPLEHSKLCADVSRCSPDNGSWYRSAPSPENFWHDG